MKLSKEDQLSDALFAYSLGFMQKVFVDWSHEENRERILSLLIEHYFAQQKMETGELAEVSTLDGQIELDIIEIVERDSKSKSDCTHCLCNTGWKRL